MQSGSGKPSIERYMVERLRRLHQWRLYAPRVAEAARRLLGPETRVYVVGGAAEDRLTVLSDIDIVVVSPRAPRGPERHRLAIRIRMEAVERHGVPWDYPLDIHVMTPEEFEEARRRYYRRVVEV